MESEKVEGSTIENVFMKIVLKEQDNKIVFVDELDMIKSEILRIISDVVELSHFFKRPETTISKTDNEFIWKVPLDDEVVENIKNQITSVIKDNI